MITDNQFVEPDRMAAGPSRERIKLQNRDLRMMSSCSLHQPDNIENKFYNMGKELNKTSERKMNEQCLQNDMNSVSIHMLNDDCLKHIFLFLPIFDRVRIERVCWRWRILIKNSWYMIKTLDLSLSTLGSMRTKNITAKLYEILQKCGWYIRKIDVSCPKFYYLNSDLLTSIAKFCPNIESVDVTGINVDPQDIQSLAKNYRNITKLSLGRSADCCDIEEDLKELFEINQNLGYLSIFSTDTYGESLLYLPAQTMHTIKLRACDNIEAYLLFAALKRLENLRHLTIDCCDLRGKYSFEVISKHCKNLRVLELSCFDFMGRENMLYLSNLTNLQVLIIAHIYEVRDEFFTNLVRHSQQLTCIDITDCSSVTDTGLAAIATLKKLEKLTINYLKNVTGDGLRNMCNLRELHCRRCASINDQSISMLIESSPQLQLLDLTGCRNITQATLRAAEDACNSRTNNVVLKMFIAETSICDEIDEETLLQTVYVNLSITLEDKIYDGNSSMCVIAGDIDYTYNINDMSDINDFYVT